MDGTIKYHPAWGNQSQKNSLDMHLYRAIMGVMPQGWHWSRWTSPSLYGARIPVLFWILLHLGWSAQREGEVLCSARSMNSWIKQVTHPAAWPLEPDFHITKHRIWEERFSQAIYWLTFIKVSVLTSNCSPGPRSFCHFPIIPSASLPRTSLQ